MMQRLVINRTATNPSTGAVLYDDNGKPLGEGSYYIKSKPTFFEKEVRFRPITKATRYFTFNAKANKYEGETVYVYSKWNDSLKKYITNQPIDNLGGVRLGRPDNDQFQLLSDIEQDYWRKKARWQLCVFGIAYFKNSTYEGDLVEFTYSGKTGLEIAELLDKFKRPWYKTEFNLELETQGDIIKPKLRKLRWEPKVDDVVMEHVKRAYQHIEQTNIKIEEANRAAIDARSGVAPAPSTPSKKKSTTELDSEIPF